MRRQVFERCQAGDEPTPSDGEAGHGVYAYPVRHAAAMRAYYRPDPRGERTVLRLALRAGERVVDLTAPGEAQALLAFARARFGRMAEEMPGYVPPRVTAGSIQRFGSVIEDYVRTRHPDAAGWTVAHRFGDSIPDAKQTVITRLEAFEVTVHLPGGCGADRT